MPNSHQARDTLSRPTSPPFSSLKCTPPPSAKEENVTSTAVGSCQVDDALEYPRDLSYVAGACCALFVLLGVPGNLLTLVSLGRSRRLRGPTTAFVLSLCCADLLFCVVNLPLTATRYFRRCWMFGDDMCVVFGFFFYGNVATSIFSMTGISVSRSFRGVLVNSRRRHDRLFSGWRTVMAVITCWLLGFGLLLPVLLGWWGRFGLHRPTFSCTVLSKDGHSPKVFLFALAFLVPCMGIIASYGRIYYKIQRSSRRLASYSGMTRLRSPYSHHREEEMRVTRTMAVIFALFLLCFLPLLVANLLEKQLTTPWIHVTASILSWMSCCINPVVYAVMNRQYRSSYVALLCPKRAREQDFQNTVCRSLRNTAV
ncbi:protein trapped in endoderm-1-like [Dermacentor andersoni]|uniref:protein trapped in endoderm-1-like n=1 Tax=Dermacentor andersoni TaxID=34620 RepID=UPI003B3B6BD7